jgi:hypothetical protein
VVEGGGEDHGRVEKSEHALSMREKRTATEGSCPSIEKVRSAWASSGWRRREKGWAARERKDGLDWLGLLLG